ncbi:hypothetical protein OROGR_030481 [Orobanche gracilis]
MERVGVLMAVFSFMIVWVTVCAISEVNLGRSNISGSADSIVGLLRLPNSDTLLMYGNHFTGNVHDDLPKNIRVGSDRQPRSDRPMH